MASVGDSSGIGSGGGSGSGVGELGHLLQKKQYVWKEELADKNITRMRRLYIHLRLKTVLWLPLMYWLFLIAFAGVGIGLIDVLYHLLKQAFTAAHTDQFNLTCMELISQYKDAFYALLGPLLHAPHILLTNLLVAHMTAQDTTLVPIPYVPSNHTITRLSKSDSLPHTHLSHIMSCHIKRDMTLAHAHVQLCLCCPFLSLPFPCCVCI